MKITKRQLKRIIKEELAEAVTLPGPKPFEVEEAYQAVAGLQGVISKLRAPVGHPVWKLYSALMKEILKLQPLNQQDRT